MLVFHVDTLKYWHRLKRTKDANEPSLYVDMDKYIESNYTDIHVAMQKLR